MNILCGALTDVGMIRKENQDSFGVFPEKEFYFVCDGMGGGAAGDFASRAAVEMIIMAMRKLSPQSKDAVLGEMSYDIPDEFQYPFAAIRLANRGLWNLAAKYRKLSGMGTTFVGVLFDPEKKMLHIYHVGDSRVYRLREGVLELLTRDHSKVNELIEQGKMREEEVKTAEIQSMITRALGTGARVKIDYRVEPVMPGDQYVLCSDGLNGELDDDAIKRIAEENQGQPEEIARKLVAGANAAGGRDNTTVIALSAVPDADEAVQPVARRPAQVITVIEETQEETAAEDRLVKEILSRAKITVPKSARQRSLISNPLVISAILTAIFFVIGVVITRTPKQNRNTVLVDLAGKVTAVRVDVRVPMEEQLAQFRKSEDTIAKLQMIQDWIREQDRTTAALPNVEILLLKDGKEQYRGLSGGTPLEVKLARGTYTLQVHYANYRIITEKMETKNTLAVDVEPSESAQPVLVLMVPAAK